ncbi:unnamed protein product [Prorocentrum cordatum]|uniref:Uncharacterized protein n=1 Tax=Prorocentrum cordatum TaxID=2364126 RepID=A0ABN9VH47_9DINO|nr:unnamed protein product [Polarella glacialis]
MTEKRQARITNGEPRLSGPVRRLVRVAPSRGLLPRGEPVAPEVQDAPAELVARLVADAQSLLTCCPEKRMTAEAASEDPYFWERPYALEPSMMPTFTETNSTGHEQRRPALRTIRNPLAAANGAAATLAAERRGLPEVLLGKVALRSKP